MKIIIGSDHRGYELKNKIINKFREISWHDIGVNNIERTDYPVYAKKLCQKIVQKEFSLGILICGSGIGMSIVANRFKGIYAGLCWNKEVAKLGKADDNINVLVLPADLVTDLESFDIINAWLETKFKGDVYQNRIDLIDSDK